MLVKLVRYFNFPELKKQTSNKSMMWGNLCFTEDTVEECDYLVILDYPGQDFSVKVNKSNILHICLEPPNEISKFRQYANSKVSLIINQLDIKRNNILSQGALPWQVGKDFDFLKN